MPKWVKLSNPWLMTFIYLTYMFVCKGVYMYVCMHVHVCVEPQKVSHAVILCFIY